MEYGYGVIVVTGEDRVDYVDNAVSNRVPDEDGAGCYALLLDPDGRVDTDMYVYNAGERLLVFTPPRRPRNSPRSGRLRRSSSASSTRRVRRVRRLRRPRPPVDREGGEHPPRGRTPPAPLTFERGELGDAGVSVIRTDDLAGEESYDVVCSADDAETVFDTLVNRGLNAVPVGYRPGRR